MFLINPLENNGKVKYPWNWATINDPMIRLNQPLFKANINKKGDLVIYFIPSMCSKNRKEKMTELKNSIICWQDSNKWRLERALNSQKSETFKQNVISAFKR